MAAVSVALAPAVTACGDDDGDEARRGGTLTLLSSGDVDQLDPGRSYYQFDFMITNDTQRTLYRHKPDETALPSSDLAAEDPEISPDGKTVSLRIKRGIRFSPPVNRAVSSKDVKYALERGFLPSVGNGYAAAYFGDLEGAREFREGSAKEISGIRTPDDETVVLELERGTGAVAAGALSLPLSAPVPKEYAARFDRGEVSTYGQHVVATGPYMVKSDPKTGRITGYRPGKRIELVRNPNWEGETDFRPAYVDRIVVEEGNDATAGNRRVLSGRSLVGNTVDLPVPTALLKELAGGPRNDQLIEGPFTGRFRYVALNTKIEPLDDLDVRRAIVAALDREAMQRAFGGELVGAIPSHFIPPGQHGFAQAGGFAGPPLDFMREPSGDPELAAEYMRKAGYASGRYEGEARLLMVADSAAAQRAIAEITRAGLRGLGFEVDLRLVTGDTMYSKFCGVPKAQVAVCPNVGWHRDFADAQTILDPTFNGANIAPTDNLNWAQLDDPKINGAMEEAKTLVDPAARARAWGEIDKLVTAQAPGAPWLWDKGLSLRSENVKPVINEANAAWDLSFISLE